MIDRYFQDSKPGLGCANLHFQIPAICGFGHAEAEQGIAANGAKRSHVGILRAVQDAKEYAYDAARKYLGERHGTGFAIAPGA